MGLALYIELEHITTKSMEYGDNQSYTVINYYILNEWYNINLCQTTIN